MRGIFPFVWVSPRGVWVLLGLSVLTAFASVMPMLTFGVWFAAFLLFAALIAELLAAPGASAFSLTREPVGRLILCRPTSLTYRLENYGRCSLRIGFVDTPLPVITGEQETLTTALAPGESVRLERNVAAIIRGRIRLGALYLWVESGLGLLRRRYRVDAAEEIEVFPDLSGVERYGPLASRKTLLEIGLRRMRSRGVGNEFESLREYAPGDAFRAINWKATARRGRMVVQQYEPERNAQVLVLLDCGRLMTPRLGSQRKFDYALAAGLSVARIAQAVDDQVGLTAFAARSVLSIAPRHGRAHVLALTRACFALQPRLEEADYELAFAEVERRYAKRGLVVLFTDIFDPVTSASALSGLRRLAKQHVVLCVLMNDAAIQAALTDEPSTLEQAYRAGAAIALADERANAVAQLRSMGVVTVDVPAAELTSALIDAYLDLKARARI